MSRHVRALSAAALAALHAGTAVAQGYPGLGAVAPPAAAYGQVPYAADPYAGASPYGAGPPDPLDPAFNYPPGVVHMPQPRMPGAAPLSSMVPDAERSLGRDGVGAGVGRDAKSFHHAASALIKAAMISPCIGEIDRESRQMGLCGLADLSEDPRNWVSMWRDDENRMALIHGAKIECNNKQDCLSQRCALKALRNLALAPMNKLSMWAHKGFREAILEDAQRREDNEQCSRVSALGVLANLANQTLATNLTQKTVSKIAPAMWDCQELRKVVLEAAESDPNDRWGQAVASVGFEVLGNLATCPLTGHKIWEDDEIRNVIIKTTQEDNDCSKATSPCKVEEEEGLQSFCGDLCNRRASAFGSLRDLTRSNDIAKDIWNKETPAGTTTREVILSNSESGKGICRPAAIAALAGLANAPCNRGEMWGNTRVKNIIEMNTWTNTMEDNAVARVNALLALRNLARDNDNRESIWFLLGTNPQASCSMVAAARQCYNGKCSRLLMDEKCSTALDFDNADIANTCIAWAGLGGLWNLAGNGEVRQGMWARDLPTSHQCNDPFSADPSKKYSVTEVLNGAANTKPIAKLPGTDTTVTLPVRVREIAMGVFWRMATDPQIAVGLWDNLETATTILNNANCYRTGCLTSPDLDAFTMAVFYKLAESSCVVRVGLQDNSTSWHAINHFISINEVNRRKAKAYAMSTLKQLAAETGERASCRSVRAEALDLRQLVYNYTRTREILIDDAANTAGEHRTCRAAAMEILQLLAMDSTNAELMWSRQETRNLFTDSAAFTDVSNVRTQEYALAALAALAHVPVNRPSMWNANELQTRAVLLENLNFSRPVLQAARSFAIATLQNLAVSPSNRADMNRLAGGSLRLAARPAIIPCMMCVKWNLRRWALATLWELAFGSDEFEVEFYKQNKHALVLGACQKTNLDPEGRAYALATMARLADVPENSMLMWRDVLGARQAIIDGANNVKTWQPALQVLYEISRNKRAWLQMMASKGIRKALTKAIVQKKDLIAKGYALRTLQNLAKDPANRVLIWAAWRPFCEGHKALADRPDEHSQNRNVELLEIEALELAVLQVLALARLNRPSIWKTRQEKLVSAAAGPNNCIKADTNETLHAQCVARDYALATIDITSNSSFTIMSFSLQSGLPKVLSNAGANLVGSPQVFAFESLANIASPCPFREALRKKQGPLLDRCRGAKPTAQYNMWNNNVTRTLILAASAPELPENMRFLGRAASSGGGSDQQIFSSFGQQALGQGESQSQQEVDRLEAAVKSNALSTLANLAGADEERPDHITYGCPNLPMCIWRGSTGDPATSVPLNRLVTHADDLEPATDQAELLRVLGLRGLRNLCDAESVRTEFWFGAYQRPRAAVLHAANLFTDFAENAEPREEGVCALRNLAKNGADADEIRRSMWQDPAVHTALVGGAALEGESNCDAKKCALEAIMLIAKAHMNKHVMWVDGNLRAVLIAAANEDGPFQRQTRLLAVATLKELSIAVENKKSMWVGLPLPGEDLPPGVLSTPA